MSTPVPHRWWALAVLATGLSMIVLDATIVAVALPTIIADLHLDLSDAQWVNAVYSVIFAALLLGSGRLGDRVGRRTMFIAGVVLFCLGSVFAAAATSGATLIAARAVQGIGGAAVLPSTLSTVNAVFREGKERAAAFGVWGAVISGMAAVGPLLGGYLTTHASWPWIFWVNLPIGLLVVAGALLVTPNTKTPADQPGADVVGLLASALGVGLVVFAIIENSTLPLATTLTLLAAGLVVFAGFLAWERQRARRGRTVVLDLGLFGSPTFSWGNLTAFAVATGEFALVFVLPLYLVNVLGLDALHAGWVLAAMALGAFVAGAQARHLAARLGAAGVVLVGLTLELLGVALTALLLGPASSPVLIAATLVVYGVGLGLASAQLTSTVLADVPADRSGQASATQSTVRQLGSAVGAALAGSSLAVALGVLLTQRLGAAGVTGPDADRLIAAVTDSAGGALGPLREQAAAGVLGPQGGAIADALTAGFASATALSLAVAAFFLALGLLGALRVARAARR